MLGFGGSLGCVGGFGGFIVGAGWDVLSCGPELDGYIPKEKLELWSRHEL
jgi:hypothetical protein